MFAGGLAGDGSGGHDMVAMVDGSLLLLLCGFTSFCKT